MIFPDYDGGSIYNLSQTVMKSLGLKVSGKTIKGLNEDEKKMCVVLMDGFGYNMGLNAGVLGNEDRYITSVFPSITTTVLTTMMSGLMPGEHGVLGVSTYLKKFGSIINNFDYSSIYSKERDQLREVMPMREAFSVNDICTLGEQNGKSVCVIAPQFTAKSELSTLTHGVGGKREYYSGVFDCFTSLRKALSSNYDYVYAYLPFVDSMAHKYGPDGMPTVEAIRYTFRNVKQILEEHKRDYTSVITADHGHVRTTEELNVKEIVDRYCSTVPFGASRSLFLSADNFSGLSEEMSKYEDAAIFEATDKNITNLMGSLKIKEKTSFNTIIAATSGRSYNYPKTADDGLEQKFLGKHGGLSEDEMLIPLVVIQ
ncbi:alkaline phosphatase family protein [Caldiplasma sukawensis]